MKKLLIGLLVIGSSSSYAKSNKCINVNGNRLPGITLNFDKNTLSVEIPTSSLGLGITLKEKYDPTELYGMQLFEDDGSVTYTATIGTDVNSDYILLVTSGDVDTMASFYRCPKSGIIID